MVLARLAAWMWFALAGLPMTCLIDGPARWDIGAADNPSLSVDCPDHPYSVCHGYPLDLGVVMPTTLTGWRTSGPRRLAMKKEAG